MFFSYPQWLGQAPDPSMIIPPQPTFRPSNRAKSDNTDTRQTAPVASENVSSFANISSSSSSENSSTSHQDESEDEFTSWGRGESIPDTKTNTYSTAESVNTETFVPEESMSWSNDTASNHKAYAQSGHSFEPEAAAGQPPPAYQETETYFYRFSDFYPYVYITPLNYVQFEHHHPMPFHREPETIFREWCGNIMDDMYRRDFATRVRLQDSQRRATWSSPPLRPSKSSEETRHSTSEKPKESETFKKSPKLGTYSFSFSQREMFFTSKPNHDPSNAKKTTMKPSSRPPPTVVTPLKKPFVYSKPLSLKEALSQYEEHWSILSCSDSLVKWNFHTLPWPQFPSPKSIEDINTRGIRRFLLAGDINMKVNVQCCQYF